MPKVTDAYLASKREFIIQCAEEIFREKPLYQMTMRDIIKKTGYSQGAIYRYYANLDEIYLDLVNAYTPEQVLEAQIDQLLASNENEAHIIMEGLIAIGSYIESLQHVMGGKIYFELLVTYAYDAEKRNSVLSRLKFKQSLEYAQSRMVTYLEEQVQRGLLNPIIPLEEIVLFTCTSIDGIANDAAISQVEDHHSDLAPQIDIVSMFQTLSKAITYFLGL